MWVGYSKDEDVLMECYNNLLDAVPSYSEEPLNSIEIWHKCIEPKFSWTRFKRELFGFYKCGVLEKIGLARGAQFYKWKESA